MFLAAIEDQDYKEEKINCRWLSPVHLKWRLIPLSPYIVWDNVYGFDYSIIKDIALREPLVDTVELKAVVTNPCLIKVLFSSTLYGVLFDRIPTEYRFVDRKKRGFGVHSTVLAQCYAEWLWVFRRVLLRCCWNYSIDVHAFLAWFDVSFDCTHKKVQFSTGPHAKYTHWKWVHPRFIREVAETDMCL
jgi:protein arginine N-methyltransferase 1